MPLSESEISRRHTASHILSAAIMKLYPHAKRGVGPWTDEGFYQDFDFGDQTVSSDLFGKIEKQMKQIIAQNYQISAEKCSGKAVRAMFADDPFKQELIDEIVQRGEELTIYRFLDSSGKAVYSDLCAGPHLKSTKELGAFKLTRLAAAYWRGDEKKPSLTRIYGVAFATKDELKAYEKQQLEAAKRDHRRLGKELELFAFDEEVGPGLPLWLPNGTIIVDLLEDLARRVEHRYGYQRVRSPHIAKADLYKRSGHLPYYAETMFPPMELDQTTYYLKAMNCPHHHKIYAATPKSYRQLPVRFTEYGHCYRYEDSGALFGLMRVRSLCMNDAHIYCTESQFEKEFTQVIQMYLEYFQLFGIERYEMRLSKHAPEKLGKKYVDEPALWKKTEAQVRTTLENLKVPFVEADDEAAFYGPKIDVQVWSAIGREFTLATNQLDFAVPKRFNLTYTDENGEAQIPLCIHRAPLSTHERFIGFLIEHYAGAFPVWLAPVQAVILPVHEGAETKAKSLAEAWNAAGARTEYWSASESLGKRLRSSQTKKIPLTIILGEKELAEDFLTVRQYGKEQDQRFSAENLLAELTTKPLS